MLLSLWPSRKASVSDAEDRVCKSRQGRRMIFKSIANPHASQLPENTLLFLKINKWKKKEISWGEGVLLGILLSTCLQADSE